MECPFCAETIKDEAIACKHCTRDLRMVRPVLLEIQDIVADIEKLQRSLDRARLKLERYEHPLRFYGSRAIVFVIVPTLLLVAIHILVTIMLNVSPLPLRLASVVLPAIFGYLAYSSNRAWLSEVVTIALATSIMSVTLMLTVTGLHDDVSIIPQSLIEWREVFEYGSSIFLAFLSGHLLAILVYQVFPSLLMRGGKPNRLAFRLAKMLGQYVGEDQLRRRARLIQDLLRTAGPLLGVAATGIGSVYAGLKGLFG